MGAACGVIRRGKANESAVRRPVVSVGGRSIISSKRIDPTKSKLMEDIDPAQTNMG
jgi:hypothetical protein